MNNTKAQNVGQIFVYLTALVVVGVIILVGYRAITGLQDNADDVTIVKFQTDMKGSIKSLSNQYGTLRTKKFKLSDEYSEVCFLDNYAFDTAVLMDDVLEDYPLIYDTLDAGVPTSNAFLMNKQARMVQDYSFGELSVSGNFACFPVKRGVLEIKIEGKGDHVVLS